MSHGRTAGRVLTAGTALAVVVLLVLGGQVAATRAADARPSMVLLAPQARSTPDPAPRPTTAFQLDMGSPVVPLPEATLDATAVAGTAAGPAPTAITRAAVVVDTVEGARAEVLAVLADLDGVVAVTTIRVAAVALGGVQADVAAVDLEEFRPFTPDATASHQPLWDRLAAGDVAVTHEFGTTHDVPLGSLLGLGPRATPVRVGAFATNGTPPVADAIIDIDDASLLGPGARDRMLIGLAPEASPTATVQALERAGLVAEAIPDPRIPSSQTIIPPAGITPENVWDHLALCESSGDWHINTGNGYYGGIQFLPESWRAVGGTGLPHEHSREEQIYRGTLLWQIQGWNAWPQCARKLGLIVDPPPPPPPPADEGPTGPDAPGMQ